MIKFNKESVRLIIIAVVIIIVLVIGVIYYSKGGGGSAIVGEVYKNEQYGFKITFPDSWKGYAMIEDAWTGWPIGDRTGLEDEYQGPKIIFRNTKWTSQNNWQDIPIMIFTPDVWDLVMKERVMVSSALVLPEKIGQNSNLIFATPPRWTFNNDPGMEEAIEIVKTFKTFNVYLTE